MGCGIFLGSALQRSSLRFWFSEQIHIQVRDYRIFQFSGGKKRGRLCFHQGTSTENELVFLRFPAGRIKQGQMGLRGTRKVAIFMTCSEKIVTHMLA